MYIHRITFQHFINAYNYNCDLPLDTEFKCNFRPVIIAAREQYYPIALWCQKVPEI